MCRVNNHCNCRMWEILLVLLLSQKRSNCMKHDNFMHQNLNGIKYFWKLFEMYCVALPDWISHIILAFVYILNCQQMQNNWIFVLVCFAPPSILSMYLFGETRFKFKFSQQLKICFWIYVDELHILLLSIISSQ